MFSGFVEWTDNGQRWMLIFQKLVPHMLLDDGGRALSNMLVQNLPEEFSWVWVLETVNANA